MENSKNLKLKRHETFSIRNGWLEKGINVVNKDPLCFRRDDATRLFGIGTNMVKSLKYWLTASRLVEFNPTSGAKLTELGDCLYNYDKYLEDEFSWWLIHYYLSTNFSDSPVMNELFNLNIDKFDKDYATYSVKKEFERKDYQIGSITSLESDMSVVLRTYCSEKNLNPEDSTECPLGRLNLIAQTEKQKYTKEQPKIKRLNYRIVYFCLLNCIKENSGNLSCNIEDLCDMRNNPLKIFNLSKSSLFLYLDEMDRIGLINLVKTAGLNTIYIEKELSLREICDNYYEEEK